jgi:hypothetical protein
VPHLPPLLAGDVDVVKQEVMEVVRGARAARPTTLVRLWFDRPIDDAARLDAVVRCARESGCDGVVIRPLAPELEARLAASTQGVMGVTFR